MCIGPGEGKRQRIPVVAAALLATSLVTSAWVGVAGGARAAPPAHAGQTLTASRLAADLRAGVQTKQAPPKFDPPLSRAGKAKPIITTNGCNLTHAALRSKPCLYGDRNSHTYVVLFGDSHAAVWFPALNLISQQRHWRLAIFTKDGCPPVEVNIAAWFRHGGAYSECTRWRNSAKSQIASLHPLLVVVTTATYLEYPEARPEPGVPTGYGSTWQNGLAATFGFLHRVAQHVIFISDTPTLGQWAPGCVSRHLSDVRRCTTRRGAAILLPKVRTKEIGLARQKSVSAIDPIPWFCTPTTCPAIVGNILIYRDNAHMTPTWSRFIAPVLADAIAPIVVR